VASARLMLQRRRQHRRWLWLRWAAGDAREGSERRRRRALENGLPRFAAAAVCSRGAAARATIKGEEAE